MERRLAFLARGGRLIWPRRYDVHYWHAISLLTFIAQGSEPQDCAGIVIPFESWDVVDHCPRHSHNSSIGPTTSRLHQFDYVEYLASGLERYVSSSSTPTGFSGEASNRCVPRWCRASGYDGLLYLEDESHCDLCLQSVGHVGSVRK